MTGIFFMVVVIAWLWAAVWLTRWVTRRIERNWLRLLIGGLLFVVFIVAPVIDEVIGGVQFKALCKSGASLKIDPEKIKGKTVRLVIEPSWQPASDTALPIAFSHYSYRDIATDDEYASYSIYRIKKGGRLIQMLGISEGDAPLTIQNTVCSPEGHSKTYAQKYEFNLVQ